jgi:hypothetical protein
MDGHAIAATGRRLCRTSPRARPHSSAGRAAAPSAPSSRLQLSARTSKSVLRRLAFRSADPTLQPSGPSLANICMAPQTV